MRRTVLLTIAASALTLAAVTTAGATTRHHRHHIHYGPAVVDTVPAPAWGAWVRPGECVTDEGGGRVAPCDHGGGRR